MQGKDNVTQSSRESEAMQYNEYVLRKVERARVAAVARRVWSNEVVVALFRVRRERVLSSGM